MTCWKVRVKGPLFMTVWGGGRGRVERPYLVKMGNQRRGPYHDIKRGSRVRNPCHKVWGLGKDLCTMTCWGTSQGEGLLLDKLKNQGRAAHTTIGWGVGVARHLP